MAEQSYKQEKAENDAQALSSMVNNMSFDPKLVAQRLVTEHRTIQQCIMRFCIAFVEAMAAKELDRNTDPRNEDSVKLAKKIIAATDERDRYLPFV